MAHLARRVRKARGKAAPTAAFHVPEIAEGSDLQVRDDLLLAAHDARQHDSVARGAAPVHLGLVVHVLLHLRLVLSVHLGLVYVHLGLVYVVGDRDADGSTTRHTLRATSPPSIITRHTSRLYTQRS